jgi:hypothetical protein
LKKLIIPLPRLRSCLFDLLDVITTLPPDPFSETPVLPSHNAAFSTPFISKPLTIIFRESDHPYAICKAISFVFNHWDTITADSLDRARLLAIVFDPTIFQRLALFWSQLVRSFIIRLIVFRLSHIKDREGNSTEAEVEMITRLNARIEVIRKRHAELEPSVLGSILEDEDGAEGNADAQDPRSSFRSPTLKGDEPASSQAGMKRSRSTISMLPPPRLDPEVDSADSSKAEQLAANAEVMAPEPPSSRGGGSDKNALEKATKWFKKSFGGSKKSRKGSSGSVDGGRSSMSDGTRKTSLSGITEVPEDAPSPRPSRDFGSRLGGRRSEDASSSLNSPTSIKITAPSASVTPSSASPLPTPSLFTQPLISPGNPNDFVFPSRSSFESSSFPSSPAYPVFNEQPRSGETYFDARQPTTGTSHPFLHLPPDGMRPSHASPFTQPSTSSVHPSSTDSSSSHLQPPLQPPHSQAVFAFEFAGSPRSDSFDNPPLSPFSLSPPSASDPSSSSTTTGADSSSTIIASKAPSQRMSRSFSKRSSLLTPLAQIVLEGLKEGRPVSGVSSSASVEQQQPEEEKGYEKRLHPYAVKFFAEIEDCMGEYHE